VNAQIMKVRSQPTPERMPAVPLGKGIITFEFMIGVGVFVGRLAAGADVQAGKIMRLIALLGWSAVFVDWVFDESFSSGCAAASFSRREQTK
jgi:hypothetical protein